MSPKVSIILPMYNGASFVQKAIRSIQAQTFQDWELIILDDGSKDESLAICDQIASLDSRIKVYANSKNLGLAATMNRLVSLAQGEYIAVQEQDDVSLPQRLDLEVAILDLLHDVGIVSGVAEWIDDQGKMSAYFPGILHRGGQYSQGCSDMVRFLYVDQCKVVNAGCMFRRSVLDTLPIPLFDEEAKMSIDWQFFLHLAHHYKVWGLPDVVVRMNRGTSHQHLTAQKELQFQEARRCIRKIYSIYHTNQQSPINFNLYCRAMSTEFVLEGRNYSRGKGFLRLMQAIAYSPFNKYAWKSLFEIFGRGVSKVGGFLSN